MDNYGDNITMGSHKMRAEAMIIKNGLVQYFGVRKVAEPLYAPPR